MQIYLYILSIWLKDYDDFDLNNEIDELEKFLKVPVDPAKAAAKKEGTNGTINGAGSREVSTLTTHFWHNHIFDNVLCPVFGGPSHSDSSATTK